MIQESVRAGQVAAETLRRFEETAKRVLQDGAVGFGELTTEHFSFFDWHPYESAPPDHSLLLLLADIAARNNVPMELHMEVIPRDMPFSDISPFSPARRSSNNPMMLRENQAG